MKPMIVAGADEGIHLLDGDRRVDLPERAIGALATGEDRLFAVADDTEILALEHGATSWRPIASLASREARCLMPASDGLFVGTSEAHLLRLGAGSLERLEGFERIAGREAWFTPWGGPPATRSLSGGAAGEIYANVHVGGIPRSDDGGATWRPTIEIGVDAHEVRSPTDRPGLVVAATAYGLAVSHDSGESWQVTSDGLGASYARAVALAGDVVLLTASDGPRGGHAGVHRRRLSASEPFERCATGLPEWFEDNIDTGCLQAAGDFAAFGTATGEVFVSEDAGGSWELAASGLPPVRCLVLISDP